MNFLVTGAVGDPKDIIRQLEQLGHNAIFLQNESEELPCDAKNVQAVICNGLFLHHPIEQFETLKYIQLTSAGFDRVDMEYIASKDIRIYNAAGVYNVPMAEFALCGVLQLYKKSKFFLENQKERKWVKSRELLELNGKTVVIIGCGNIGTQCAKRFKAFDCNVLGIDIYPRNDEMYEKIYPLEEIDDVLKKADIVVLTLPLTEKTKHFIDKRKLGLMKRGAVVVNIARGAIIDTKALEEALKEHLGGAALDVFEEEPLSESGPLWDMDNVILTPHNSFVGEGNRIRLRDVIKNNLESFR